MKRFQVFIIFSFFLFRTSGLSSQVFIDPGAGVVWNKADGVPRPMVNIGVHNLILKRCGIYGTIELPSPSVDNSLPFRNQRDVGGGIIRLNDFISFFAGVGIFSDGILSNGLRLQEVRKEAGLMFNIPAARLNIDVGYSNTAGFSFLAGFIIPFKKSKVPNFEIKNIPQAFTPEPVAAIEEKKAPEPQVSETAIADPPETKSSVEVNQTDQSTGEDKIRIRILENPDQPGESSNNSVAVEKLPDGIEVLEKGVYAVKGVFRIQSFAISALDQLRKSGFSNSGVGFEKSSGFYYVWVIRSEKDAFIKEFVKDNRKQEGLSGLWVLWVK
jgi:hypothetical protein